MRKQEKIEAIRNIEVITLKGLIDRLLLELN